MRRLVQLTTKLSLRRAFLTSNQASPTDSILNEKKLIKYYLTLNILVNKLEIEKNLFWIGHASFYIKTGGMNIFIDPFRISDSVAEKADLILVTHAHMDHNSKEDIDKIRTPDTKFIGAAKCLDWKEKNQIAVAAPGFKTKFANVSIEAVPSYNLNKDRLKNHPKAENWVGYILEIDGKRIYHAGDTDMIPEMKTLRDIDVALLPMGGTYTMAADEAIEAARAIKPRTVIPMHYKMLLGENGSKELEKKVESELENALIMKEVQKPNYSF